MSELHRRKQEGASVFIAEWFEGFRRNYEFKGQYDAKLTLHDTATIFVPRDDGSGNLKEIQCEDHELHGLVLDTRIAPASALLSNADYIYLRDIEVRYDGEIVSRLDFGAVPVSSVLDGKIVEIGQDEDARSD